MSSQMGEGGPARDPQPADYSDEQPRGEPVGGAPDRSVPASDRGDGHRHDIESERERYGGVQWGAAFFGWLSAAGAMVLVTAILAGIGAGLDHASYVDVAQLSEDPQAAGLAGGIVLLVVVFVAYVCGGYVAGRMARFDGMRQGVAVWFWTLVITGIMALLGWVAGNSFDVSSQLSAIPAIPLAESDRTLGAVVAGAAVLLTALIGAVLGGLAGMRFHRKVDALAPSR